MFGEFVDRAISIVSPTWALQRTVARASLHQLMTSGGGNGLGGYQAAKMSRFNKHRRGADRDENGQPRGDITNLRKLSWDLYRNNSSARKICRSLESKVIGKGMIPRSTATLPDGSPHTEFRKAVRMLWMLMQPSLDYRGSPGHGGQLFSDLARTALRQVILSGEVLVRRVVVENADNQNSNLPNTRIRLIHAARLSETPATTNAFISPERFFYGIELDANERRVAYHLQKFHPSDPRGVAAQDAVRVPATKIAHLFISDDIDQLRGVPWFSAALGKMANTEDYEYNELKAAAVSACVVLGYRRSSGQSSFGLNTDSWDSLTDADGNKITSMQPGMVVDLGRSGELQGFNPMRPNAQAPEFIQHLQRSQATAVPGTKSSTVTGDYRRSSFSAERAADNDTWPEIEALQEWFGSCFYQPIFDELVISAVVNGVFNKVFGIDIDVSDFNSRKHNYLGCTWHGPVAKSINPTEDAKAARERIRNAQTSPQIEAGYLGQDWQSVLNDVEEFYQYATALGLPESYISQALGIDQTDQPLATEDEALAAKKSEQDAKKDEPLTE